MKVFGQGMAIQNRMPQLIKTTSTSFSRENRVENIYDELRVKTVCLIK